MPRLSLVMEAPVRESFRVARVRGLFDLPSRPVERTTIEVSVPLEELEDWTVGLITGASGSGKSLVANTLWPGRVYLPEPLEWPADAAIIDSLPGESVDDAVEALVGVGLSSVPTWLRPYATLSVGERFRATMARLLLSDDDPLVVDEFTSVVDRTVARAVSVAVSRFCRRKGRRFVAVTCHRDVVDWLDPDWVLDMDLRQFFRRERRGRPPIRLRIYPGSLDAWTVFHRHHYLTAKISPAARVFLATVQFHDDPEERLAGFFSVLPALGMPGWVRGTRTVVLPDFQGLGIGNRMVELVADWLWEHERLRYRATTSSPAIIRYRLRHPDRWALVHTGMKAPSMSGIRTSAGRLTTSWEYIPSALRAARTRAATGGTHPDTGAIPPAVSPRASRRARPARRR